MTTLPTMKKTLASTLSLAVLLSSPGFTGYQAFAQVITPAMGMGAGSGTGAAVAGATGQGVVGMPSVPSTLLTPVGAPIQTVAPNGIVPIVGVQPTAGLGLPAKTATGKMGQAPQTLPSASAKPIAEAAGVAKEDGKKDATPSTLAAGRELGTQIQAADQGANPTGSAAPLERFWSSRAKGVGGDQPITPEVDGGEKRGEQPSGLAPADANAASHGGSYNPPTPPVTPETHPEMFRPQSSRVGVGPVKYVWWNSFYNVMQWFNLKLARDPNRRVSWDKWPTELGLLYLLAKIRYVRSGTLTDPYDYATKDNPKVGTEPKAARTGYTADGSWVSDRENPRMGAENTRFGSNIPPKKVRPDVENMNPSAREVGKLKWRRIDPETGKPIVQPAMILNDLAGGWIQFQFHGFGGNTKRDPIEQNPHKLPRAEGDKWPGKEAIADRTPHDATRVSDNGRPTPLNERTQAWIQAQIYGTNEAEQAPLRSFSQGKMKLNEKGILPEDPKKPGIDQTGFNNNYNPQISFLHWVFTVNHNNIAEHIRYFNPDWDDETLFQYARKINVAEIDLIHTVQWTEDLLQHPTLQRGMHTEFYGFVGPKLKAYIMRLSYRHPWFARLVKPITDMDEIWGMPGSRWEHHDGPFQVPKQFRMVYRLHEMILDDHEIKEPGSDRTLGRIDLINFVHGNTRPIVEKFGYDVLAYSFVRKSAGALKLHNFPRALSEFKNQQNGNLTDLAEMDIFRERTDGTGTYNEFRKSVGEPPVVSFMELTGGDAELAKELAAKYEGDIEKVDAGIGILAEPKPAGFALGFTQFYQFVLNAPRRVKSNRHLTEYFTHKDYTPEGMDWVLHSGGMGNVIARGIRNMPMGKDVLAAMEGVTKWFAPWPDTETFPLRMLEKGAADSSAILKTNYRTLALGAFTAASAVLSVAMSPMIAAAITAALAAPILLYYKRMLAWRFMQKAWQGAYTDRRGGLFPTLFKGEKWAGHSASLGSLGATAVTLGFGALAWGLMAAHPIVAVFAGVTALSGLATKSKTKTYATDMAILKIALQNRLRDGARVTTDAKTVPGATALEKRYWFLRPAGSDVPVARFGNTYGALREHGLPVMKAFGTTLLSHLIFGPKTQAGLGLKGRWKAGVLFNPFAIYMPNLIQSQGYSNTRIYARRGNTRGITPGDVDLQEFDEMFKLYAPGRDYLTAYDMSRMREGNRVRDAREGRGNRLTRFTGERAAARRAAELLELYADRVVEEDRNLVPAISRDLLLRVYQGTAQVDVMKERALDGLHPALQRPQPFRAAGE